MRSFWTLFLVAALIAVLATDESAAERLRRNRKLFNRRRTVEGAAAADTAILETEGAAAESEGSDESTTDVTNEIKDAPTNTAAEQDAPAEADLTNEVTPVRNPCVDVNCGAGRVCQPTEEGEPKCICIPECPPEADPRRMVCSNHNETWESDCAVHQARCRCKDNLSTCRKEEDKHLHIEYFGECREMPECTPSDMVDFPRRMRDWLFNVMRDMAEREELSPHYIEMQREAENNLTRRWTNAAVWKWCDLDGHPHDRTVSRHELFPIRAPLMAMEHCIAPFLDKCDSNDDHHITLQEWGTCLELDKEDINAKCEEVTGDA